MVISYGQTAAVGARASGEGDREWERMRLLDANRELARANRAQADFFANVSHDLRGPLTSLREFISIVIDGLAGPITEPQSEYLHIALRNADTLAEMIEQILAITRIQQGSFRLARKRVSIAELLDRDVLLHGAGHGGKEVRLDVELDSSMPDVFADPDRVLEVIRNLVDNAIKYSGDAVEIRVSARSVPDGVVIAVRDNGVGIDPLTMKSMFKRFSRGEHARRVRPGGLGLGLTIVQEIVELHGGTIEVQSEPGKGSIFSITLPPFDPRAVVGSSLRDAWRRSVEGGGGFAFVRACAHRWEGALQPTAEQIGEQIREAMTRCLGPLDEVVPAVAADPEVAFILAGEPDSIGPHVRRCLRTVTDRLRFQVGAHVEWHPCPDKVHSSEFPGPQEMTEAVLRWFDSDGGDTDVD